VVDDLVAAAQLRVLVGDRVEAVRAAGHDRAGVAPFSVSMFCWASMLNTNSCPSAGPGRGQVSAGPSTANDTPAVQQLGDGLGPCGPGPRAHAQPPEQVRTPPIGRRPRHLEVRPSAQSAAGTRPCPTRSPLFSGSSAWWPPRPGTPTRSAPGSAHVRDVVDARCPLGIPAQAPQLVQDHSTSGRITPLAFHRPAAARPRP
jgi:hypothetical protein